MSAILIVFFLGLAGAYEGTPANNNQSVSWQAAPTRRGSWSIISSYLAIIFACTWTVQHLNGPGPEED